MVRSKKKTTTNRSNETMSKPSGFIFTCDDFTRPQCFELQVFGLPIAKIDSVLMIEPGIPLFLFDCQNKVLYGIYTATSNGGLNLVPHAFGGQFPAQVKFQTFKDCLPKPERVFRHAIQENYYKGKFTPALDCYQVNRLLYLFEEDTVPRQPPPPIDSRNSHHAVAPSTSHYPWTQSSVVIQHYPSAATPTQHYPVAVTPTLQFYATPAEIPTPCYAYATPAENLSSYYAYATPPSYPAPPSNYQHYPTPPSFQVRPPTALPQTAPRSRQFYPAGPAPPYYRVHPSTLLSQTAPPNHQFYPAPQTDPSHAI